MKKVIGILIIGLLLFKCKEKEIKQSIKFNQQLADELKQMAEVDQIVAYIPQGKYKKLTKKQWNSFKDSVFISHEKRLKQIFKKYGFVGFDLAGEEGSRNFWLMVQHSDHNPNFQQEVLNKMKIEIDKKNANSSEYGLLVDRVKINIGQPQTYGTQVDYDWTNCQAFPKKLEDSINVNKRRKEIGLETLEKYLNEMSKMHFEINKEIFLKNGITEPKLYENR